MNGVYYQIMNNRRGNQSQLSIPLNSAIKKQNKFGNMRTNKALNLWDNASKAELSWADAVIVTECATTCTHNHGFQMAIAVS